MRPEGWPARLRDVISRHRAGPPAVGSCDCASLAADAVHAVTGEPLLREFMRYSTRRGAVRVLRNRGFETVRDVADALFPRVPVELLRRGDLAWGPALGESAISAPAVVDGATVVAMSHAGELLLLDRDQMTVGWSVG